MPCQMWDPQRDGFREKCPNIRNRRFCVRRDGRLGAALITPTTSVRRLIFLLTRSNGFVDQICRQ